MLEASRIREELKRLVEGEIPLDHFEDWLVGQSWNMHVDAGPVAQAFVAAIELRLAEYSSSHLSWEQMVGEFRSLLDGSAVLHVRLNADPVAPRTGSSISIEQVAAVRLPAQPFGKELLTVYG